MSVVALPPDSHVHTEWWHTAATAEVLAVGRSRAAAATPLTSPRHTGSAAAIPTTSGGAGD
jgi:hypothetical protein